MREPLDDILDRAGEFSEEAMQKIGAMAQAADYLLDLRCMAIDRKMEDLVQQMRTAEREGRSQEFVEDLAAQHFCLLKLQQKLRSPAGRLQFRLDIVADYLTKHGAALLSK